MEYGTEVAYREVGSSTLKEKIFKGKNHATEAFNFVASHVKALSKEEFEKLPEPEKKKFSYQELNRSKADEPKIFAYVRKQPLWDWHVFAPFSVE